MSEKLFGCQACSNMYKQFGESQCRFEPHTYKTLMQKNIVKWLCSPFIEPWIDKGCPGWVNYITKESKPRQTAKKGVSDDRQDNSRV